ncbi:MAG: hypothetical protein AAGB22_04645 [Bacteroidota bacterium]
MMDRLRQLSYRKKNLLLLVVAILFGLIAYQRAFKKTVQLAGECATMEQQIAQARNAAQNIARLETEVARIDLIIGDGSHEASEVQHELLERVSTYCEAHKLRVSAVPEPHAFNEKEFTVHTNAVTVKGGFVPLLQLIHGLEQEFNMARLSSVKFHTRRNRRTRQTQLYATIYLQNIDKA